MMARKSAASGAGETAALLARAGVAQCVAALFAYPAEPPDFAAGRKAARHLGGTLAKDLARVEAAWRRTDPRELRAQWLRLFSLMPLCPPYETAMFDDATRKGATLADVAGFYRAFGLQAGGEMADHIASEMGFAAHVLAKIAYAHERGWSERAEVAREAFAGFFGEHLGPFAAEFFPRAAEAGGRFYGPAARFGMRAARDLDRLAKGWRRRGAEGSRQ